MADNFNAVIDHLIIHESGDKSYRSRYSDGVWGFVNNPLDRGGATIHGVTKKNWERYTGKKLTLREFKLLLPKDVKRFYYDEYWMENRCNDLPCGIDYFVFDYAVNSGKWSAIHLQRVVGAIEDGVIGDRTLKKVQEYINCYSTEKEGIKRLLLSHEQLRRNMIAQSRKIHTTFKQGLSDRIDKVIFKCYELIDDICIRQRKPLDESNTIKEADNQIKASAGAGVFTIASLDFENPIEILRQLVQVKTLLEGIGNLAPYIFIIFLVYIIIKATNIKWHRVKDWVAQIYD